MSIHLSLPMLMQIIKPQNKKVVTMIPIEVEKRYPSQLKWSVIILSL